MTTNNSNLAVSIKQRLRNHMKKTGESFEYITVRYGYERFLYRLSVSKYASDFILKGALLFYVWNQETHRPTRDIDLLGFGSSDINSVKKVFEDIIGMEMPEDGLIFNPETLSLQEIREEQSYGGLRIKIQAKLGNIRVPIQVDVGYGDAITPEAQMMDFPVLLDNLNAPKIRTYPVYTVVAEKLEAMVSRGDQNSRMKDFFDIHFILKTEKLNPQTLSSAIQATFGRRNTGIPIEIPRGLTEEFAFEKDGMWKGFLRRNRLESINENFMDVVKFIRENLPYGWKE